MAAIWELDPEADGEESTQPSVRIVALASVTVGEGHSLQLLTRGGEYLLPADQASRLLSYGLASSLEGSAQKHEPSRWALVARSFLLRLGFAFSRN